MQQTGPSDSLVIAVDTNGAQQQKPQEESSKKSGMFGLGSSFKMPKMPKLPTRQERREQNQTPYCDANGNEQTIVEDKRRSTTSMNIYY